jgi:hypothetical protein
VYSVVELSQNKSGFEEDLQSFIDKYVRLWQNSSTRVPVSSLTYTTESQRSTERETNLLIDTMDRELRNYPGRQSLQTGWRDRMMASLRQFAAASFRLPESCCEIIFSKEYIATTRSFIHRGRAFDPKMETAALAQALRNVWVMNCLQLFLGMNPSLTPSIFAYSMLYPYTDNMLDSPILGVQAKETACRHLGQRLAGCSVPPDNTHEEAVFKLVEMIEGEFPRALFPEVYASLMAIHSGQIQSLKQQQSGRPDDSELLQLSIAKGGSSVLADGWLAGGKLEKAEADFFFGYGVMLQLMDDLQDLSEDRAAGHWTLFTRAATSEPLDHLTNKLWSFTHSVLNSTDCFADPQGLELKDLIRRNSTMLILRAIAECADLFSSDYVRRMECFSPLGFAFLRNRSKDVKARFEKIWPGIARRRKLRSILDLMG